ncbi:MAG: hypothetical protein ACKVX9_20075 [Blastocatellia bacterium]
MREPHGRSPDFSSGDSAKPFYISTSSIRNRNMPSTPSNTPPIAIPAGADDFTRIRGISPRIALRLYDAGIITYSKLAAMTAEQIVGRIGTSSGVTVDVVHKREWIGQAAKLAARSPLSGDEETGLHEVSYVIEFLLNAENNVRQTKILHVKSNDEQVWEGWQSDRLVGFFTSREELSLPEEGKHRVETAKTLPPPEEHPVAALLSAKVSLPTQPPISSPFAEGALRRLETLTATTLQPAHSFRRDEDFLVRLSVELAGAPPPHGREVNYQATILAKRLGGKREPFIVKAHGTVGMTKPLLIDIKREALPPGIYRLAASIALRPEAGEGVLSTREAHSQIEGGLLEVH